MSFNWITDDGIRTLAIVGICKNAGKTSLLNYILRSYPAISFGVFSTGIDGEEQDSVFHTPKPAVELPSGTLFCCDSSTSDARSVPVDVVEALPDPQRPLWVARALHKLSSMITGPATVRDQISLGKRLLELGVDKVLVDGSLDRKSIALSPDVDAIALVAGASFGPMEELETELGRLHKLSRLPVYHAGHDEHRLLTASEDILLHDGNTWRSSGFQSLTGHMKEFLESARKFSPISKIYLPGALTASGLETLQSVLSSDQAALIVRHPDCLKLEAGLLDEMILSNDLQTLIPFRIKGFAVNPEAVGIGSEDATNFRLRLRNCFPELKLVDIMETTYA